MPAELALLVSTSNPKYQFSSDTSRTSINVLASFVTYDSDKQEIRNLSASTWGEGKDLRGFADLQVNAYADANPARRQTPMGGVWGVSLEFRDVFSADLSQIQLMAKTLAKLEKRMESFREEWGEPPTFGDYVKRVAKACQAKHVITLRREPQSSSYDADRSAYLVLDAKVCAYNVNRAVERDQDKAWEPHAEKALCPYVESTYPAKVEAELMEFDSR